MNKGSSVNRKWPDALQRTFIVIGWEHYNPLGVIRSLGEEDVFPVAIIRKGEYQFASLSKYISKLYLVDDYEESLDILKQYENEKLKPIIIPCDDVITRIVDREYNELSAYFITSNAGEAGRIGKFTKKHTQNELAKKCGVNVANTWEISGSSIPDGVVFPVITKPTYSYDNWKNDYHICSSKKELEKALDAVAGPVFLQQYIEKETELCIDGVVVNNGKEIAAIQSIYTYALPDYYSSEMVVSNFSDKKLRTSLISMFTEIGYEGIFEAEFMVDKKGELWFLEINFRNSTWSYAATSLGMNLPLLFAQGCIDGRLPSDAEQEIPEGYIALAELMDFFQRVMGYRMISPLKWLKGVLRADCLYYYNKKDRKPFFAICSYQFKKIVRSLIPIKRK